MISNALLGFQDKVRGKRSVILPVIRKDKVMEGMGDFLDGT